MNIIVKTSVEIYLRGKNESSTPSLKINHLPIFGTILGLLVFVHGLWSKSKSTQMAAYNLFIVSAIGAAIAYFTGEPAEDLVEDIPGIVKATIEAHEEAAEIALFCIGAMDFYRLRRHSTPGWRSLVVNSCVYWFLCAHWSASQQWHALDFLAAR